MTKFFKQTKYSDKWQFATRKWREINSFLNLSSEQQRVSNDI